VAAAAQKLAAALSARVAPGATWGTGRRLESASHNRWETHAWPLITHIRSISVIIYATWLFKGRLDASDLLNF
jgi:hypothetical protein